MLKLLSLCILCFSTISVNAQDSNWFLQVYNSLTIYGHGWRNYLSGQRMGHAGLMRHLLGNSASEAAAKKGRKGKTISTISTAVSLGALIYGLSHKSHDKRVLFVGHVVLLLAGVVLPFSIKARKYTQRSIWLYNRDVLAKNFKRVLLIFVNLFCRTCLGLFFNEFRINHLQELPVS